MKTLLHIILFAPLFLFGQNNLVFNWSFEQYDSCPSNYKQLHFASGWFQPNKCCGYGGSSDYFNSCNQTINSYSVPSNAAGYQFARTGVGYAGIALYSPTLNVYREYIETKLIDSLMQNKVYCIEFYVSLCNRCNYAIDKIGAYLSSDSLLNNDANYQVISLNPQIQNSTNNIISDTLSWLKVSGIFTASGGEQYVTIGNFYNNVNTNILNISAPILEAYYYIDDVSVYLCEDTVQPPQNLFIPTYIKNEEYFYITGLPANSNLQVYNAIGQIVFKENNYTQKLNTQQLSTGIYFYNLQLPSGEAYRGKVYFEK